MRRLLFDGAAVELGGLPLEEVVAEGSLALTFDGLSGTMTGAVAVTGSASVTFDGLSASAGGRVDVAGEASVPFDGMGSTASGTVAFPDLTGTLTAAFDGLSLEAEGLVGERVSGSLVATFDSMIVSATGRVESEGGRAFSYWTPPRTRVTDADVAPVAMFITFYGVGSDSASPEPEPVTEPAATVEVVAAFDTAAVPDVPLMGVVFGTPDFETWQDAEQDSAWLVILTEDVDAGGYTEADAMGASGPRTVIGRVNVESEAYVIRDAVRLRRRAALRSRSVNTR